MTAARCLQGTAQSGQLHCILKSVHYFGKIFNPILSAIVKSSGSSSLFSSLLIITGLSAFALISFFISGSKNVGIITVTSYGFGRWQPVAVINIAQRIEPLLPPPCFAEIFGHEDCFLLAKVSQ